MRARTTVAREYLVNDRSRARKRLNLNRVDSFLRILLSTDSSRPGDRKRSWKREEGLEKINIVAQAVCFFRNINCKTVGVNDSCCLTGVHQFAPFVFTTILFQLAESISARGTRLSVYLFCFEKRFRVIIAQEHSPPVGTVLTWALGLSYHHVMGCHATLSD